MLKVLPKQSELNELIAKVDAYPVSAHDVAAQAEGSDFDQSVVVFYKAFPANHQFKNEEDLAACSEQLLILNGQDEQPYELWQAPEED